MAAMKRTASPVNHQEKRCRNGDNHDIRCIDTVRILAADMVQKANSGHPGAPMGLAPTAFVLWSRQLNFSPKNPTWANRDRFVLSNGHGCCLQYIMLHLTGYSLTLDDLKNFRQLGSKTPGHPENFVTPGIEVTTGPLGQGLANGVGMAIAEAHMAATYNKPNFDLFDSYVYVMCGDGCQMEGVASEACSLAGHLGLGKLIVLYDDNKISIDGSTDLSFTEDVEKRFQAYGWHTVIVGDGDNDLCSIESAVVEAKAATDKPSLVLIRTTIGFGSLKEGTQKTHGAPLGADDLTNTKKRFGFDPSICFHVDDDVRTTYMEAGQRGDAAADSWEKKLEQYAENYPAEAKELRRRLNGQLPTGWKDVLPKYTPDNKPLATRHLQRECLDALANIMPEIMGGSADLTPSNMTSLTGSKDFQKSSPEGRYIRFGVREHAMCAIANGMTAYGGFIPYVATFLNFLSYCWPSVRLAALSKLRMLAIMTHDSIGLGEDGPTHQPVEMLALARATPNVLVIRPADGNETVGAFIVSMERMNTPSVMCYSRQNLPHLPGSSSDGTSKGAYVIRPATGGVAEIVLISTGSEVHIAIQAAEALEKEGRPVTVVSAPILSLFDEQPVSYRTKVIPQGCAVFAIEASSTFGWEKYSHYCIGMKTFGASAPGPALYDHFGLTAPKITAKITKLLANNGAHFKGPLGIHLDD